PARSRQRLVSAIAAEPRIPKAVPQLARARSLWGSLGWVAAAVMIVLSILLMRQNASLTTDVASLRSLTVSQQSELQQTKEIVEALLDPKSQKIELVAVGSKPQPRGKAIYLPRNRNLIFLASHLSQLPPEKIYELWLFPANGGAPIAAGLF